MVVGGWVVTDEKLEGVRSGEIGLGWGWCAKYGRWRGV